jgi:hypothetical protein
MYAYIACNKMQACSVEGKCFLVTFRAHDSSLPLSLSLPLPFLCSALSSQPYELLNLADALEKKQFSDGQCIIKQGDQASTFYIVEGGTTRILKEDPVGQLYDTIRMCPDFVSMHVFVTAGVFMWHALEYIISL